MIGRSLPSWDLDVSSGSGRRWISGAAYAAQKIRQKLQLLRGEWFADLSLGFPLIEDVLVKNPRVELIRSDYRKTILEVPGIVAVKKIDVTLDRSARNVKIAWVAIYEDGTELSGTG